MTQPVDSSILHEIVRIVEARRKVPERVQVRGREYLITYLEDHQRRLEEAIQRYDSDRLNMLYGQLASKVKYQLLRRLPAAAIRKTAKEKPKASSKAKPKPQGKAVKKPKTAKKAAKTSRSAGTRSRGAAGRGKTTRGKAGKPVKRVAARKTTPARSGKRGGKRKPPKK